MLLSEWELWACANALVNRFGGNAHVEALRRANELADDGDMRGEVNFIAIARRVEELLAKPAGLLN